MGERLQRVRNYGLFSVFTFVALVILANGFIKLPYYIFAPGNVYGVNEVISVPADRDHPHDGDFLMTTVSLREGHPLQLLYAGISPTQRVEKKQTVSGDLSPEEFSKINEAEMKNSQQEAIAVGMQRAGFAVKHVGTGALIKQVIDGTPMADKVKVGEVVVGINGQQVDLSTQLTDAVSRVRPGETVKLTVKDPAGVPRELSVVATTNPSDANRALLGVLVTTDNARLDTPFPVEFKNNDVGGPSAGLAFTLGVLDDLTPGSLAGDKRIATTGTIASDGTVGEVGGVAQKAVAVQKSGAKLFLVPTAEVDDAKTSVGNRVKVVGVNNLDEAIAAIGEFGGDVSGIPTASALAAS